MRSDSLLLAVGTVVLAGSAITCTDATPDPVVEATRSAVTTPAAPWTFTTLFTPSLVIEGLTADADGNLYSAGRGGTPTCPVWRIPAGGGAAEVVGTLPAPCSPNGLAFDRHGALYVSDGADKIYKLVPDSAAPPAGVVFASGAAGANGLAFDRAGNLWATDGGVSQGKVYRITPDGVVSEAFRVPPLANLVNAVAPAGAAPGVVQGGVGRDDRALPPGSIVSSPAGRTAADALGSVAIVANGIAFTDDGRRAFIADTARGAIWKVEFDVDGELRSPVGCDTTFTPDTLCLDDVFVQHPALEGLDGIALDKLGNVWGTANERNAVVVVTPLGSVHEAFRNPPDPASQLRNGGPLEFPTSPFLVGRTLCITQSDVSRRDNFPNTAGEVGPAPALGRAKISCADAKLPFAGLELPIR